MAMGCSSWTTHQEPHIQRDSSCCRAWHQTQCQPVWCGLSCCYVQTSNYVWNALTPQGNQPHVNDSHQGRDPNSGRQRLTLYYTSIFLNEIFFIWIQLSLKLVPECSINNSGKSFLIQVMDLCPTDDKPSPELMSTQTWHHILSLGLCELNSELLLHQIFFIQRNHVGDTAVLH